MNVQRFVHQHLWSAPRLSFRDTVKWQATAFERACVLVRVFYAAGLLWVVMQLNT